jgi:FtsH-binding integral membrane protein
MALSISITLFLLISHILFFKKKKMSFLQNSVLFMVIGIISKNYITIMTMQLEKLATSQDDFLFVALLLYRDIIIFYKCIILYEWDELLFCLFWGDRVC